GPSLRATCRSSTRLASGLPPASRARPPIGCARLSPVRPVWLFPLTISRRWPATSCRVTSTVNGALEFPAVSVATAVSVLRPGTSWTSGTMNVRLATAAEREPRRPVTTTRQFSWLTVPTTTSFTVPTTVTVAVVTTWPAVGDSIATDGGVVSRSTVTLALAITPVSLRATAVRVFLPSRSGTPSAVKPPASSTASTPFTCTATAVAETAPVTRTLPWLVRKPLAGVAISTVTGAQSRPSSTWPLQSLSMPSQTSGLGVPGVQACGTPPTQLSTVRVQAPTPQGVRPRPSSTCPLQSLSMPSQTSGLGVPGVHRWGTPPTQLSTVRVQAPTPQVVRPRPSSTWPLQSLSMPSQTSGLGVPGAHHWCSPP